jgi:hypothetical protein
MFALIRRFVIGWVLVRLFRKVTSGRTAPTRRTR